MESMKAIYLEEANELLGNLEGALLQLDETPEEKSLIEEIFRIMHTLKGNSSMFGFTNIAEFIHKLETVYDKIRNAQLTISKEIIDATFKSMDHIKDIIDDPELEIASNKEQYDILTKQAETFTGQKSAPPTAQETPAITAPETKEETSGTYLINFKPGKSAITEGNNPLYLIDELFSLGECKALPYTEEVKNLAKFNPSDCITGWSILLSTDRAEAEIKEVFVFVEDISEVNIEKISDTNLLQNTAFSEQLEGIKLGKSPLDISSLDIKKEEAKAQESPAEKPEDAEKKQTKPKAAQPDKKDTKEKTISSIRVSSDKLDDLMNLVSELITTQAALSLFSRQNYYSELEGMSENVEKLSRQLRDIAFGMTLIPINNMFGRFQRMVRDLSKELSKEVALVTEGGETELDKSIIESLTDPLMHILRNSMDHGIESKERREELGKPAKGTIRLKAYYSGTNVNIEIKDDGKGIDPEVIRNKAIEKGLITENTKLSDKETYKLLFHAGFSTAKVVTDVSGRGVGMDVVRRNIDNLRGDIDIESEIGAGTTLTISLPLSLSIIDGLLVEIGKGSFVIPLAAIDRCFTYNDARDVNKFTKILELEEKQLPFVDLRETFDIKDELDKKTVRQIVVVFNGKDHVALVCDHIVGEYQAVIKPLGSYFKKQDHISGSTILGDGTIALVFDTNRLIKRYVAKETIMA
ncbi:MAG: chemotaxis protein CheA [Bacteroidota bacterium]